jgi:hypothetical protein
MSRQVLELESLLQELIAENQRLLKHLQSQQAAMRTMDVAAMDASARQQDASRMRLLALEARRRNTVNQILQQNGKRLGLNVTIAEIAAWYPARSAELLKLRKQLKDVVQQVQTRAQVAGRVAGAVLGHLNTVVRLIAGAVEKAGLYTQQGVPKVSSRIGVMEAVG